MTIGIHPHGPKLEYLEFLRMPSQAWLVKESWPAILNLDGCCDDGENGPADEQENRAKAPIQDVLDP